MKRVNLLLTLGLLIAPLSAAATIQVIPDVNLKSYTGTMSGKHTRAQVTVFNEQTLSESPTVNLSEILQQQQSTVRLTNNSGDASQTALSIRGFGDNAAANSLILVDGFPLVNPSLLAPDFNSIPLTDIKRMEIFQGSQGSLWGNQAVGGVVNIITRHPQKLYTNSIFSVGSYNKYGVNLFVSDKFQHGFFAKAFGVLTRTDNYRNHNQLQNNNIALQMGNDYASGSASVNVQSYTNTANFPGGLSQQQMDQNPRQAVDFKNYSRYRTNLLQLFNRQIISDDWLLETRLSDYTTDGDGKLFIDFTRKDKSFTFNPRLSGKWHCAKIIAGYDGVISTFNINNVKTHSSARTKENDIYLQAIISFHKFVDFTLGARGAMQNSRIQSTQTLNTTRKVFVSEQGLTFHVSEPLSFYLRRDGNFSLPKANEQISAGSDTLHAQTGVSYETGAEWQQPDLTAQINFYRLLLHQEIAFDPAQTASHPFGAWNNLDATRRDGASLSANYQAMKYLRLNSQLNYVNARFQEGNDSGKNIPAVPAVTGNAGADLSWRKHWHLQYFLTYTGTRYASEDNNNTGPRLPSYWVNDAALQYGYKNYLLSFEVINIFNGNYASYAYYNPDVHANVYYPAAGRNYLLSLKVNLDE